MGTPNFFPGQTSLHVERVRLLVHLNNSLRLLKEHTNLGLHQEK